MGDRWCARSALSHNFRRAFSRSLYGARHLCAEESREVHTQKSWRPLGVLASWVRHESDALPSEMKGVHPEKKLSKTGSEAPCAAPRGARQKRSQNALGRKSRAAKLRAVASSKPSCSLVTRNGDAEPL